MMGPTGRTETNGNRKQKKIKWATSAAKYILLEDLEKGMLGIDEPTAAEAWDNCYSKLPEFADVPFNQFRDRLKGYREKYGKLAHTSASDEAAFHHDRFLYARQDRNKYGKLVFDVHPAKEKLREDVKRGLHKLMDHHQLRNSMIGIWNPVLTIILWPMWPAMESGTHHFVAIVASRSWPHWPHWPHWPQISTLATKAGFLFKIVLKFKI